MSEAPARTMLLGRLFLVLFGAFVAAHLDRALYARLHAFCAGCRALRGRTRVGLDGDRIAHLDVRTKCERTVSSERTRYAVIRLPDEHIRQNAIVPSPNHDG